MITLYGLLGPNVAKTRASLLHKGLAFEHVQVDLVDQSEEFRRLTPIGRVPLIRDGDLIVHDSLFIAEYLDRRYPDAPPLLPDAIGPRVKAYTIFALLERMMTIASPLVAARLGFFDLVDPAQAACSGYHPVDDDLSGKLEGHLNDRIASLSNLLAGERYFTGRSARQPDFAIFAFMTLLNQIGVPSGPLSGWMDDRRPERPFDAMFSTSETEVVRAI